ncbi:MAG: XTP/dITP diphosphatase [Candidatus Omnitrophica bacterium]|nr:XTP/dITP diphosphatase [Candidatus Omnitrophota bacterium]
MNQLLIATKNKGKVHEIADLLSPTGIKVISLFDIPNPPEIIEDGLTFRANAAKKAVTIALYTGCLVMGEDSGLEVDALGGRPGVYSARYSGDHATDQTNNALLLKELAHVPPEKRTARYRCAMALADKTGCIDVVEGACEGVMIDTPRGTNGFGYDPLFMIPAHQKTFGELPLHVKQTMSHRAEALRKFLKLLEKYLAASKW